MPRHRPRKLANAPRHSGPAPQLAPDLAPDLAHQYREACRLRDAGDPAAALTLLRTVVARAPGRWDAWADYGSALADLDRCAEALAAFAKALARSPDPAAVLHNRGTTLLQMGDPEGALTDYTRALALAPDAATLRFDAALAHLVRGDFAAGLPLYEARFDDATQRQHRRHADLPRWDGTQPLAGRRLLLYAEQGFGDTLQFCRYAPLLAAAGARISIEVQPALATLLRSLGPDIAIIARGDPVPVMDLVCPLLSIPLACGMRLETIPARIPYLTADATATARFRERFGGPGPVVGLVWSGNERHRNDARRSLDPALLGPLVKTPGMRFVSLQKDVPLAARKTLAAAGPVLDIASELTDFAATAAAVAAVDVVVTVDTAVAHLAGALGRPVWVLLPFAPDWRWLLHREDSPWYPTARLFRQRKPGDWAAVIRRVAAALADRLAGPPTQATTGPG
jgi:hypothetical protein